jgi:hypothetical protein
MAEHQFKGLSKLTELINQLPGCENMCFVNLVSSEGGHMLAGFSMASDATFKSAFPAQFKAPNFLSLFSLQLNGVPLDLATTPAGLGLKGQHDVVATPKTAAGRALMKKTVATQKVPSADDHSQTCMYCLKESEDLLMCSGCHYACYCNQECQRKDWKQNHKRVCQKATSSVE